jgi:hypothetical protein
MKSGRLLISQLRLAHRSQVSAAVLPWLFTILLANVVNLAV